jgi:hypothetical protein
MHEQRVHHAALRRLAMTLLCELDQRTRIRVNSDEKFLRRLPRRLIDEPTVASAEVDDNALLIRSNQVLKSASIELGEAFAANDFQHKTLSCNIVLVKSSF